MRAVCWEGTENIQVETVPDPVLLNPRDAIIKVTTTAICGSDLHIYDGYIPKENTRPQPNRRAARSRAVNSSDRTRRVALVVADGCDGKALTDLALRDR